MCLIKNFPLLLAFLLHPGQTVALDMLPYLGDKEQRFRLGGTSKHQSGQVQLQEDTQGLFQTGFTVSKYENLAVSLGNLCKYLITQLATIFPSI